MVADLFDFDPGCPGIDRPCGQQTFGQNLCHYHAKVRSGWTWWAHGGERRDCCGRHPTGPRALNSEDRGTHPRSVAQPKFAYVTAAGRPHGSG